MADFRNDAWELFLQSGPGQKETLAQMVTETVADMMDADIDAIDVDTPLVELGVDTLMSIEFLRAMEEKLGVFLPEAAVTADSCLRDFAGVFLAEVA
ncbi:MAG: acyl carrier protein [Pseudomonadota bacterium]